MKTNNCTQAKFTDMTWLGYTYHRTYGFATYVRNNIGNDKLLHTKADFNVYQVVPKIADITVVNVYKPSNVTLSKDRIENYPHPTMYAGDLNSHHTSSKYRTTAENEEHPVN